MSYLVSVIIPTYNRKDFILKAISSVFEQTYKNYELIVVDDASNDNTETILNEYFETFANNRSKDHSFKDNFKNEGFSSLLDSKEYDFNYKYLKKYKYKLYIYYTKQGEPIKYIKLFKNKGVSVARNIGISIARGALVSFLDSDDLWLKDKLEKQVALYSKEAYKLCHTDEIWIRNKVRVNPMKKHKKKGGDIFSNSLSLCFVSPSSAILEKSLFNTVGIFDESMLACEDYDLWLRIFINHEVSYIDEKLIIKNGGHSDQLSRKYWGMDRYRVRSLIKLIKTKNIDKEKKILIKNTLVYKLKILKKGSLRRFRIIGFIKYSILLIYIKRNF
jgi:glycosyltransferase involved in cell wall biosynthesis